MSHNTKNYRKQGGDEWVIGNGGKLALESGGNIDAKSGSILTGIALNLRIRVATADVNAGLALLPALSGYKYRIIDLMMIAIGGAAATATSVDIVTTQGGSAARPFVVAVAALTRSTVVTPTTANVTVLADGASFIANDANSGVYISKQAAGSNLGTATHIDVILSYMIEKA